HRFGIAAGRDGDPDFTGADVDAGGVGMKCGELSVNFFLCLLVARGHNLPLVKCSMAGGRPAASKEQVEQSPERDAPGRGERRGLTSDLHGGCGTKLTHGL